MTDLSTLDATAQAELVRTKQASPAELVDAAIERIEKLNGELNAVIHPLYDRARAAVQRGLPDGPFPGVPIVRQGSRRHARGRAVPRGQRAAEGRGNVATTTSHLFAKLEAAGFVIVGKTNTPEFGLMPTTEPAAYGPTHNPWNTRTRPGGSSGGTRGRGRERHGAARPRGRRRRLDPHPRELCGLFGLEAEPRAASRSGPTMPKRGPAS